MVFKGRIVYPPAAKEIDHNTDQHQNQKSDVPPSVKHKAGERNKNVLSLQLVFWNKPVDREDQWKENNEIDRVEEQPKIELVNKSTFYICVYFILQYFKMTDHNKVKYNFSFSSYNELKK